MPPIDFSLGADVLGFQVVDAVLGDEGGYQAFGADLSKGATNWGITHKLALAKGFTGDMKDLTRDQAIHIYIDEFWIGAGVTKLAAAGYAHLAYAVMDWAVNSGAVNAIDALQIGLNLLDNQGDRWRNVLVDGIIGPEVIDTLEQAMTKLPDIEHLLTEWLNANRIVAFGRLAQVRPEQEQFMVGWLRRVGRVQNISQATPIAA